MKTMNQRLNDIQEDIDYAFATSRADDKDVSLQSLAKALDKIVKILRDIAKEE